MNSGKKEVVARSFARRDHLLEVERDVQRLWDDRRPYEANVSMNEKRDKYFVTFPYPYMNGRLHLGHAFTLTKAEFQARFQRTQNRNVLWPLAFHCTGMPIAACADKLKREFILMSSDDKKSNDDNESTIKENDMDKQKPDNGNDIELASSLCNTFKGKKSKAAAKTGVAKGQWEIMRSLNVAEVDIPRFVDSKYWLDYFPPRAVEDLTRFGMAIDWRRSFITTNANPCYDAFVKWQFRRLRSMDKVKFGKRHCIFSRVDGQPCADHDRASGEGVAPQEYLAMKQRVLELKDSWKAALTGYEERTFFVAATLRPETMYAQTNSFVLPEGRYGVYAAKDGSAYVCSYRAASNMCYQDILKSVEQEDGSARRLEPIELMSVEGTDLIGTPLHAPLCPYDVIYALPMSTISMEKGTGVVTSVPSDAPDDYAALKDLQDKPGLRERFNVKEEWTKFDVVEVVEIPGYGRQSAVKMYNDKKIQSQKDTAKLAEAKAEVYLKGFYEGVMLLGSQKGKKVCDAKPYVRDELIKADNGFVYYEPEKQVMSRSGDSCVVALTDQWYLVYGEDEWRTAVESHINDPSKFNAHNALAHFNGILQWFKEWACSRNYGLGTYLPWDDNVVIESLSDSTIYMAYYTIAHYLQGSLDGTKCGSMNITPEDLTDEFFDFVFALSDQMPLSTKISQDNLAKLRREFTYWYPMDLRVSGKDLIGNHLTMSLYNHVAIWKHKPEFWPRSFFTNGHILVDNEKMSKSLGNFLTLADCVTELTADATRLALADAGDSLDDANYCSKTADTALLRLYNFEQFCIETVQSQDVLRSGPYDNSDVLFLNEMAFSIEEAHRSYSNLVYRDALKYAYYEFQSLKDFYKTLTLENGMHRELILKWTEMQCVILSPICPHICEHIYTNILKKPGLVVDQLWPQLEACEHIKHRQFLTLRKTAEDFRKAKEKLGSKAKVDNTSSTESAIIYVARAYAPWQQVVLNALNTIPLDNEGQAPKNYMNILKSHEGFMGMGKKQLKETLSFADFQMKEVAVRGKQALDLELPFDEQQLLADFRDYLKETLQLSDLVIWDAASRHHADEQDARRQTATPSQPVILFYAKSS